MWWKTLSVLLVLYVLAVGMLVPLKPGLAYVAPSTTHSGDSLRLTLHGYNTFYTHGSASEIRVWLEYDSAQAILGQNLRVLTDTTLEATFVFPANLPVSRPSVMLNAILSHPTDGVSLLPSAVEILPDTAATSSASWTQNPVAQVHIVKDFSFPYRNVIYESIRNTFYHVPMWFALMFLFATSVGYSVKFLLSKKLDFDRKASAYAEAGLLFGLMGLVTGMLWAKNTWGAAWSNDIKQLMTAVVLLIYLAYFILRSSFDEPEKGARLSAVYNIFAYVMMVVFIMILPRLTDSLHPGNGGNPAFGKYDLDDNMRMIFYPAVIGWILISCWILNIKTRISELNHIVND